MIGYHYTGMSNWKSIVADGKMMTYEIRKPDLGLYFSTDVVQGIWIWKRKLVGLSHFGTIILQAGNKKEHEIVMLELQYEPRKIVRYDGREASFKHFGNINGLVYHESEPAVVYRFPLTLDRIKLVRVYELTKIIEAYETVMDICDEREAREKIEFDRQPSRCYASITKQKHNFV